MTPHLQIIRTRIIKLSLLLACFITVVATLKYIISLDHRASMLRTTVNLLVPDYTFESLTIVLFPFTRKPDALPVCTIIFMALLFFSVFYFKRTSKALPLTTSLLILVITIAMSIGPMIRYFNEAMQRWRNLPPAPVYGLEGGFLDLSRYKPSIGVLIAHMVVLLLYMLLSFYIIRLIRRYQRLKEQARAF
jgi:hypothetical protein